VGQYLFAAGLMDLGRGLSPSWPCLMNWQGRRDD